MAKGRRTEMQVLQGDRPLKHNDPDALGFEQLAIELANALATRSAPEGMVVGLEGRWGSGKSSLVNLILNQFEQLPREAAPITIQFKPWLIGSRDALISSFFDEMAKALASHAYSKGDATAISKQQVSELSKKVRRYAGYVGSLAPATAMLSVLDVPGSGLATRLLESFRKFSKDSEIEDRPLEELKEDIENELAALNKRIVVVVDDVDRLDPNEIAELLRLIRSVADFPQVTYLLCFDQKIVGDAVVKALKVADGPAYLEKIFQVTVRVPAPEPFALKRMFEKGLEDIIEPKSKTEADRLAHLVDTKGGEWLDTPRSVNRTLDAIRFIYPSIKMNVDAADLVWITLIRINNPELYDWIETYLGSMAALSTGRAHISEANAKISFMKLKEIIATKSEAEETSSLLDLGRILPGFDTWNLSREDETHIFKRMTDSEKANSITHQRLASPNHYRYYFAMALPTIVPKESELESLVSAIEDDSLKLNLLLRNLADQDLSIAGNKLAVLLERVRHEEGTGIGPAGARALITAFSDILDDPKVVKDFDGFLGPQLWRQATELLPVLRTILGEDFSTACQDAFRNGDAIAWLTDVLRKEGVYPLRIGNC